MKKLILGVLSLIVPMALVVYNFNVFNNLIAEILGYLFIGFMLGYTGKKFSMIGKRGYNNLRNAFGYASVGNAVTTFVFLLLTFIGARICSESFWDNQIRFAPIMASVVYFALIGIVACAISLLKMKNVDMDRKALMIFIATFLLCIAIGCCSEILKSYGIILQDTESLSILLILSAGGASVAKYRITKHNKWEYA